jgi:hypothetical protein
VGEPAPPEPEPEGEMAEEMGELGAEALAPADSAPDAEASPEGAGVAADPDGTPPMLVTIVVPGNTTVVGPLAGGCA